MEIIKANTLTQVNSTFTVTKAKDLPEGQFEAVLSTEDLDRHGEIVSIKGLIIPKDQVIKMYYNHMTYGEALPIGKWLRIWKKNGVLMGLGEIDLEDDFAVKVGKKIKAGYLDSISIGFYPQEYDGESSVWTKSTLVEASVVAEPANVNAKITSKALGYTEEEFDKSFKVSLKAIKEEEAVVEPVVAEPIAEIEDVVVAVPAAQEPVIEESTPEQMITAEIEKMTTQDELEAVYTVLKAQTVAVGITLRELAQNPTGSTESRIKLHIRSVKGSADTLSHILKVTLKESK